MNYVKIRNEQVIKYPYYLVELASDNPQISFPQELTTDILEEYGIFPVTSTTPPAYDSDLQKISEGLPTLVEGFWTQTWNVEDLSPEELEQKLLLWRSQAVCSPLQATLALYQFGVLEQIEAYMAAPETAFVEKLAYQRATEFRRMSPTIIQLQLLFEWDDEMLDNLFKVAMTIEV